VRLILGGMVAGTPGHGGATWAALQYALGLRSLGHDVLLLDEVRGPGDPAARTACLQHVADAFGLTGRAALLTGGGRADGLAYEEVLAFAAEADLLVNLAGTVRDPRVLEAVGRRLLVDLDPAFTQLWHAQGVDVGVGAHDRFASVGLRLHAGECAIPDGGVTWAPTLPPVALEHWPAVDEEPEEGVTAIANWRSYGTIEQDGVRYGQKAHSVRALIDLPRLTAEPPRFALLIDPGETQDIAELHRHGWVLIDAAHETQTPEAYARFVSASSAELGIAKEGYVVSRCGWFSDRSACYLASGRPVVAQRTGWERVLPEGDGLLGFDTAAEAAEALAAVAAEPARHAAAARALAEQRLDARRVLPELLEVGLG
jgi:Glycosyl transferases group 1